MKPQCGQPVSRYSRAAFNQGEIKKVWFITGTSRGFGKIWTQAALERGDKVAATARDLAPLDDLVAKFGDSILTLKLDVTDKAAVEVAVRKAHDHFGRLDVIVNNAGYGHMGYIGRAHV